MKVIVIGAGVVGCAIAFELTSRGAAVQVLDARGIALGATRASAGILAPHIEGHSDTLLRLATCSLGLYDGFVAGVRAGSSRRFEYERRGTLQVAMSAAEAVALRAESARLTEARVAHTLVEGNEVSRLEPALSSRASVGLLLPEHGHVDPEAFTHAVSDAAANGGATFVTGRARVVREKDCTHVATESGPVHGDAVIVAGGSWSSELTGVSEAPVKPVRGQLLRLQTGQRPASRVLWGERCYVVPRSDGSVLVGATVEDVGFDERATVAGVRSLLDAAVELVPELGRASFSEVRAGLRPMTRDELPAVGRSSTTPGVFYAVGHYRNGVLLAPLTAQLMADLVLEGREAPELELMRPDRLGL